MIVLVNTISLNFLEKFRKAWGVGVLVGTGIVDILFPLSASSAYTFLLKNEDVRTW